MTYREAMIMGAQILEEQGIADARTDAWLLLAMACKIDRNFYYLHMNEDIIEEQQQEYASVLKKRAEHIPLQYITGEQEFMGHRFLVNSNVLIPRQDTEILVEEALKVVRPGMDVLDMCTGSGCIIISILKNVSKVNAVAADISKQALNVAKENAKLNDVTVRFETSDLFEHIRGEFDVIVSNPPYIRTEEITKLMPEVRDFEPFGALDGKEDGLYFYRKIVDEGQKYLKPGGYLMFEIGCDQGEDVSALMQQAGYSEIKVVKDLAGLDRVVIGKGKEACLTD
ncbi:MAG: peptide chain release factor N(5)-glutamine methyltransferase [Lachnospiraceae bacterium]|nr:peptide chain release factor N(5)-glutamine methyltransferase [Lachnospiraceae bacterium]